MGIWREVRGAEKNLLVEATTWSVALVAVSSGRDLTNELGLRQELL